MKVQVSYQTLQLPPPFAFAYTLKMEFLENELKVKYDLEYLNREDLSREEIEAEGYSEDDDFSWRGSLGKVWVDTLKEGFEKIDLEEESEDFNVYLHVAIEGSRSGLAVHAEDWDYRLQELIQAVYEKSGIEDQLKMRFMHINGAQRNYYELTGSFEHKTCSVGGRELSWDDLQELMADVYTIDFDGEPVAIPDDEGLWIAPDADSDYQLFDIQAGESASKMKKRILHYLES